MKKTLIFGILTLMLASCTQHRSSTYTVSSNGATNSGSLQVAPVAPTQSKPVTAYPNATAFKMSGDYANNVAITLGPSGELIYFPAPTDITADSAPIELCDGWWLNCQGLGPNSVFTKYTFAEYASLPEVPSPQQLKLDIIPGANVIQFIELPYKLNQAVENLDEVKTYLKKQ